MTDITDYFSLWQADRSADPQRRDEAAESAFWKHFAAVYDDRTGKIEESYGQISAIVRAVPCGATVLDIGSGTGRFSLPLAQRGCQVTSLDRSEDMLQILRAKASELAVDLEVIHADWPCRLPHTYDVVLAAWSLYWHLDLRASLAAMVRCARSQLIIIDTTGAPTPYDLCVAGQIRPQQARHLLFAGGLAQLGIASTIDVVTDYKLVPDEQWEKDRQRYGDVDVRPLEPYRLDGGWRVPRQIGIVRADMDQPAVHFLGD